MSKATPIPIYHWSPVERRKQIIHYGLRPGSRTTVAVDPNDEFYDALKQWRAPYVSFATSPSLAWGLSGDMRPDIKEWDLWQTDTGRLDGGFERLGFQDGQAEIRVYYRIYKRDLWWVGTRRRD